MISVFVIWIIVVIMFRAIGTSHEDKSVIDRFGEIVSNKVTEEKKEGEWYIIKLKKKPSPGMFTVYSQKYPILRDARDRCGTQEKAIISEACWIVYNKSLDKAIEDGTLSDEDKELLGHEYQEKIKKADSKRQKKK